MAQPFGSHHAHVPLQYVLPTMTRQNASYANVPGLPPNIDYLPSGAMPLPSGGMNALPSSESSLPSSTVTSSFNSSQIPAWTTSYTPSTWHDENNPEPPYGTQSDYTSISPSQIDNGATVPLYYAQAYEGNSHQLYASSSTASTYSSLPLDVPQGNAPPLSATFRPALQDTYQFSNNPTGATAGLPSSYDFTFTAQPQMVHPYLGVSSLQYGQSFTNMSASNSVSPDAMLPPPVQETGLAHYTDANYSSVSEVDGSLLPPVPVSLEGEGYLDSGAYTGLQPMDASSAALPDVASAYVVDAPATVQEQSFEGTVSEGEIVAPDASVIQAFKSAITVVCNVLFQGQPGSKDAPFPFDDLVDTAQTDSVDPYNANISDVVAPHPRYPGPSFQQPQQEPVAGPSTEQASGAKRSSPSSDDEDDEHDDAEGGGSGEPSQKRRRVAHERYLCHTCNVTVLRSRQRHHEASKKHLGISIGLFWCSVCKKDYARKDSLKRHFQSKHPHLLEDPALLEPNWSLIPIQLLCNPSATSAPTAGSD